MEQLFGSQVEDPEVRVSGGGSSGPFLKPTGN